MVKIKICGLKRLEDIELANRYKIDYAGFVFAESKRKVNYGLAKQMKEKLCEDIQSVGVFVDAGTDSGPIILQKVVPVMDDDTEDTLADRILVQEHIAMPEALKLWAEGKLTIEGRKVKVKA